MFNVYDGSHKVHKQIEIETYLLMEKNTKKSAVDSTLVT